MKEYNKAILATVGTLVGGLGAAMADGNLTQTEVVVAIGATLVGAGAVLVGPANKPAV